MRRLLFLLLLLCGRLLAVNDTGVVILRYPYYVQGHHTKVFSSASAKNPLLVATSPEQLDSMMPALWLYGGTNVAVFCCSAITPERYCIHATNVFSQSYWIEKDSLTAFSSWHNWFGSFGQISYRGDSILMLPQDSAPLVKHKCECTLFFIEEISGDWMRVGYLFDCLNEFHIDCDNAEKQVMWIRWRRGTTVYADVYIAE